MSKYAQMVSTIDPEHVKNHVLNDSKAKFHWSFPKKNRFSLNKSYCATSYYNIDKGLNNRSAYIGFGEKSDFTKPLAYSPGPFAQNIKSYVETNIQKQKGKSFGLARNLMKEFGYIDQGLLKNPKIGQYEIKTTFDKKKSYTMRAKTRNPHLPVFLNGKRTCHNDLGAKYDDSQCFNKLGRWTMSNYKNINCQSFQRKDRFLSFDNKIPGPGQYMKEKQRDNKPNFAKNMRKTFIDQACNPAPGKYMQPSDFGYYDQKFKQRAISNN